LAGNKFPTTWENEDVKKSEKTDPLGGEEGGAFEFEGLPTLEEDTLTFETALKWLETLDPNDLYCVFLELTLGTWKPAPPLPESRKTHTPACTVCCRKKCTHLLECEHNMCEICAKHIETLAKIDDKAAKELKAVLRSNELTTYQPNTCPICTKAIDWTKVIQIDYVALSNIDNLEVYEHNGVKLQGMEYLLRTGEHMVKGTDHCNVAFLFGDTKALIANQGKCDCIKTNCISVQSIISKNISLVYVPNELKSENLQCIARASGTKKESIDTHALYLVMSTVKQGRFEKKRPAHRHHELRTAIFVPCSDPRSSSLSSFVGDHKLGKLLDSRFGLRVSAQSGGQKKRIQ